MCIKSPPPEPLDFDEGGEFDFGDVVLGDVFLIFGIEIDFVEETIPDAFGNFVGVEPLLGGLGGEVFLGNAPPAEIEGH